MKLNSSLMVSVYQSVGSSFQMGITKLNRSIRRDETMKLTIVFVLFVSCVYICLVIYYITYYLAFFWLLYFNLPESIGDNMSRILCSLQSNVNPQHNSFCFKKVGLHYKLINTATLY